MANRVDVTQLEEIFDTDLTDVMLSAFITAANAFVNANLLTVGLSNAVLTEIEKFLAAHLASHRDQRAQSEGISGEYNVTFQGKTDMGLNATFYGQTAMMLDTSGTLASLNGGANKRATFLVATTPRHGTLPTTGST